MKRLRAIALAALAAGCNPIALIGACGGTVWYTIPKEISDDTLLIGGNIERIVCGVERLRPHTAEIQNKIDQFCDALPDDLIDLAGKGIEMWRIIKAERAAQAST